MDCPETLKGFFNAIQSLVRNEKLIAYHDISDGGLFTTVCEMAFAGHTGVDIDLSKLNGDNVPVLFNEELGAVIQIRESDVEAVNAVLAQHNVLDCCTDIGRINNEDTIRFSRNSKVILENSRTYYRTTWHKQHTKCNRCVITLSVRNKNTMLNLILKIRDYKLS